VDYRRIIRVTETAARYLGLVVRNLITLIGFIPSAPALVENLL